MTTFGSGWTSYNWQRDALLPGVSALLEALWAYAWISFLFATSDDAYDTRFPFIWILGLLLLPGIIGRWLDRAPRLPERLRQFGLTVTVLGLFAGFMYGYHEVPSAWLVGVVLLARGVWLALGDVSSDSAPGWFLVGLAAFLALLAILIVAHPKDYGADLRALGPMLALYLFAGLGWLALVRQQEMQEESRQRPVQTVDRAWLMMLAVISAALISFAALASSAGRPLLLAIEEILVAILGVIWAAAKAVVLWMSPFLIWLFSHMPAVRLPRRQSLGAPKPQDVGSVDFRLLEWLQVHIPPQVLIAILSVLMMVLLGVWLAIRYRARGSGADDEERSSLWSWRLFWAQLRNALRGVRLPSHAAAVAASSGAVEPEQPASSVRQLYIAALRWSRERGQPRPGSATPDEFAPVLGERLAPDLVGDLTDAYVQVRYGEVVVDTEQERSLRERWQAWQAQAAAEPAEEHA
ncbi:MAG: DUF4129 domain-containing protein [Chloroflexi bacterium]|nr:DUF4129 domain-containing protein [Chloroflexota bacterium]